MKPPLDESIKTRMLELAAEIVLELGCHVWPALNRARGDLIEHYGRENLFERELSSCLDEFRALYPSAMPWPEGDGETRCLAFLLLLEIRLDQPPCSSESKP